MSSEPSYPKDAAVGDAAQLNQTLGAAVTAKEAEAKAAAKAADTKPKNNPRAFVRGAAVGVGSAALVAALLYANANRKGRDKA